MVVSAQTAYTVGETSDEAVGWALLGPEGDWDGEVGFRGVLGGDWVGLQELIKASPASAECAVCKIRSGRVKAEEFVEDDLELVLSEGRFHVLNAVDVGQPRDMFEEGWCRPGGDFLVDLEGCATADFPCI